MVGPQLYFELLVYFVENAAVCVDPLHFRFFRVRLQHLLKEASPFGVALKLNVYWLAVVLHVIQRGTVQVESPFVRSSQSLIKKYPLLGALKVD